MKKATFWLLTLFFSFSCLAQHSWEVKHLPGFLVPHNANMYNMMAHMQGVEVGRQWRLDSGGNIDRRQQQPLVGLALTYFALGNEINGKGFCMQGFYEVGQRLFRRTSVRARLSVGIGYLSRQFDVFGNPQNRAIGSHINGFMQALGYFETRVHPRIDVQYGLGMSHFSNGNWGQPNLGINLPGLLFGVKLKDKKAGYKKPKNLLPNVVTWEFSLRAGKRQMSIDDTRNIVNYLAEVVWNYPHNDIRRWRGGVNVYYDRTYLFEKFQPLPKGRIDQVTEVAITAGHEYKINRLGFITDLGFYVYRPNQSKRMYYEAVGLRYYILPNVTLTSRLKAHLTSADYFEWGLTWQIPTTKETKPGFANCFRWLFRGMRAVN